MRTIRVNGDLTEEFVVSVLPNYIINTINIGFNEVPGPRKQEMEEYLFKEELPDLKSILSEAENQMIISTEAQEVIIITFDSTAVVEEKPIMPLIKLIEFGNMEIKGLQFINKAFDKVEANINNLYHLYQIGGVNNVN